MRKLKNRLYVVPSNDVSNVSDLTKKWILRDIPEISLSEEEHFSSPHSFKDPRKSARETLSSGKTVTQYLPDPIPFGENAWGEKAQRYTIAELGKTFESDNSPEADEKVFARAVASHGAAMVELKRKSRGIQKKAGIDPEEGAKQKEVPVEGWNPKSELSPSRIHLKFVLGKDFKTAEDFKDSANPQRDADIANLRHYFEEHEYASGEVSIKDSIQILTGEFKRPIEFTDHDLEVFADILSWEENNKRFPFFYHATEASIGNLWKVYTHLRELTMCAPLLETRSILRGTDIYFRNVRTMADILKNFGKDDYDKGRASVVLCANYVLTAGLKTTKTSSSSVEYFLNNHSVEAPVAKEMFEEAVALAGIPGSYTYFNSLFLQYMAHRNSAAENSVMLGLSIPPYLLNEQSIIEDDECEMENTSSSDSTPDTCLGVACGIQSLYEKSKADPESISDPKKEIRQIIPEARLSLHPDVMLHPDTRVRAFNRFPFASKRDEEEFSHGMRKALIGTFAGWLYSKNKVMPDSFATFPVLKKLYSYAYQAMTGNEIEENFAIESLLHLVSHGHLEGVQEFIKLFPAFVDHPQYNPIRYACAAMRKGKVDMLKYICEELPKSGQLFQNMEDMREAVRVCVDNESDENKEVFECLEYLFSQLDESLFQESDLDELYSEILHPRHSADGIRTFEYMHLSGVSDQLFERCIERSLANGKDGLDKIITHVGYQTDLEKVKILSKHGLGLPERVSWMPTEDFREVVAVCPPERKQELAKHIPEIGSNRDLDKLRILKEAGVVPIECNCFTVPTADISMETRAQVCKELLSMGGHLSYFSSLLNELDSPWYGQVLESVSEERMSGLTQYNLSIKKQGDLDKVRAHQKAGLNVSQIYFNPASQLTGEQVASLYLECVEMGFNNSCYTLSSLSDEVFGDFIKQYPVERKQDLAHFLGEFVVSGNVTRLKILREAGVTVPKSMSTYRKQIALNTFEVVTELARVGATLEQVIPILLDLEMAELLASLEHFKEHPIEESGFIGIRGISDIEKLRILVQQKNVKIGCIYIDTTSGMSMDEKVGILLGIVELGKTCSDLWFTIAENLDENELKDFLRRYPSDRINEIKEGYIWIHSIKGLEKVVALVKGGVSFTNVTIPDSLECSEAQLVEVSLELVKHGVDMSHLYQQLVKRMGMESAYTVLCQVGPEQKPRLDEALFKFRYQPTDGQNNFPALIAAGANPDYKQHKLDQSFKESLKPEVWAQIETQVQKLKSTKASAE